jgi:L-alanine-DL-glutamate epimerase-like enolase superfamily enzyme
MNDLNIDKVEIVDCTDLVGPGDDGHLVAVHAAGQIGWYGPVSVAAATALDGSLATSAIGVDVTDHSGLLSALHGASAKPGDAVTSWAVGALDCAVWDLHARIEQKPVAALLSTTARSHVPAYASWLTLDVQLADAETIQRVAGQDWQFTKWSLRRSHGLPVADDAMRMAGVVHQVAEATGAPAAFDALWTWDPTLALGFSEQADHAKMIWLEEPLGTHDGTGYSDFATECPPLALGERLHLGDDPKELLALPNLGALTIDVVGCGGLTVAAGLVAEAAAAGVPVYPHGRSLLPAVHIAAAFPEAIAAVEYQLQWEPHRQLLFTGPLECEGGQVVVPSAPGLGPAPRRR